MCPTPVTVEKVRARRLVPEAELKVTLDAIAAIRIALLDVAACSGPPGGARGLDRRRRRRYCQTQQKPGSRLEPGLELGHRDRVGQRQVLLLAATLHDVRFLANVPPQPVPLLVGAH